MAVAGLAVALVALDAMPALAHGLGGRLDLPVPRWLFVYGAGAALIISFVALTVLWRESRLEGRSISTARPGGLQRILTSPVAEWTVRIAALAAFLVVAAAGLAGGRSTSDNIAPVVVFVWFWVGGAFVHAICGNLWATLSPWDTLARLLDLGARPLRPYPKAWGKWPATLLLFGFVWLELVDPFPAAAPKLGLVIAAYSLVTLPGMAMFGRETWNRNGEAFAVYFELLSRISPLTRDAEGRVILRPVLGGLPGVAPQPGLVPFVLVLLGSTTYDGASQSEAWVSATASLGTWAGILVGTAAMLGVIGTAALAYALAMMAAAAIAGDRWRVLSVRFVHSLVPIAFAYVVAHYFSLLLIEGQDGLRLASDPFGVGWNLLGTAGWAINLTLISVTLVWYVQVAAIVAGHIGGVVLAHDRAVAAFPKAAAVRTQYALLGVMVLFTVIGLLVLSGG